MLFDVKKILMEQTHKSVIIFHDKNHVERATISSLFMLSEKKKSPLNVFHLTANQIMSLKKYKQENSYIFPLISVVLLN